MSFYIQDNIFKNVIDCGFATEQNARDFIHSNEYLNCYWYRYDIKEWKGTVAYGLTYERESVETGNSTFLLFKTWDDAIAYACDNPFGLIKDFDFEDDIYQIDMNVRSE